jgi:hypothetical protein
VPAGTRTAAGGGRPQAGLVGVGPGRGVTVSGGPFPRPAPPNRTCAFPRIRLSTSPCRRAMTVPSVQLGLDPQYPRPGLFRRGPRRVGIHRRPPGMPAPQLRTRCRPSPCPATAGTCGRLSRPRTTTAAPSRPATNSRRRACPPPAWTAGGEGGPRTVPTFTINRSTGSVPSYSPAASPRVRRRPSPWPPGRPPQPASESPSHAAGRTCAAARPRSARFRAGFSLAGVPPLVPAIRAPSRLACRARAVWQCRPVPSLSGLLPPSPAPPGLGCPQLHRAAATAQRWAFHPTRSNGASWRTRM